MDTEIEFSAHIPVNSWKKVGKGVVYMPGRFVVELPIFGRSAFIRC